MPPTILLSCDGLSKSFGVTPLFTDLSFSISEQDRIGLVGPNGSGKSTLLKILAGLEQPDRGSRALRRQVTLGYVPQEPRFTDSHSVDDILTQALLEEGLDPAEQGGRIAKALSIGEFERADQPVAMLSGGWRKRLAIARALMLEPDVVLLDEPTNHLDLDGILWLEGLLRSDVRAFVVVSHDRRFLESVATRIVEVNRRHPHGVFEAQGRYSDFLEQRDAALAAHAEYQASLANRVRREIEWLRRGPKARTTKAKFRVDAAHELISELHDLESRRDQPAAGIDFTASGRRSKQLIVAKQVGLSRHGRPIVRDLDLTLGPGDRLGVLGPNGSGKTTVLKLLAGSLEPDTGSIRRADKLRVVVFEQHRDALDPQSTLRRALAPHGDAVLYRDRPVHLVSWAKRFLFRPEQLDLPVARLSGGEQARLLIARLMLEPADVLILDEPTNDLDIPTLDVLEDTLLEFSGALVLVTHDRWLLDRVSTRLLALDGKGGADYYADYAQWEASALRRGKTARASEEDRGRSTGANSAASSPRRKPLTYREQREWDHMEATIAQAEERASACRQAAEDPAIVSDAEALHARHAEWEAAQAEVDRLYARWAELEAKRNHIIGAGPANL